MPANDPLSGTFQRNARRWVAGTAQAGSSTTLGSRAQTDDAQVDVLHLQ